jgi:hypothetical protein
VTPSTVSEAFHEAIEVTGLSALIRELCSCHACSTTGRLELTITSGSPETLRCRACHQTWAWSKSRRGFRRVHKITGRIDESLLSPAAFTRYSRPDAAARVVFVRSRKES